MSGCKLVSGVIFAGVGTSMYVFCRLLRLQFIHLLCGCMCVCLCVCGLVGMYGYVHSSTCEMQLKVYPQ